MPKPKNKDVVAWTDYLDELLKRAKAASGGSDAAAIGAVVQELTEFEQASPWEAKALDQVALEAAADLLITELHLRTEHLKAREQEFVAIYDIVHAAAAPKKK